MVGVLVFGDHSRGGKFLAGAKEGSIGESVPQGMIAAEFLTQSRQVSRVVFAEIGGSVPPEFMEDGEVIHHQRAPGECRLEWG
jgi:hypothetical protein